MCTASTPHRIRADLEGQLVSEEVGKRVSQLVEERVSAVMQSEGVRRELAGRLERERTAIGEQVCRGAGWVGEVSGGADMPGEVGAAVERKSSPEP